LSKKSPDKANKAKTKKGGAGVDLNALALSIVNRATGDPAARMPTEPAPAVPPGFPYTITIGWSAADFCYVGRVRALDVAAYESTPADAARQAHAAGEAMLERLAERGEPLPPADLGAPADALGRLGVLRTAAAQALSVAKLRTPKKRR
jgi:predicted RNase H-like HicB family nuclease